ncbi:TraY domain-containing protein [Hafnia paralvei]|uniref:TraY domain-containing protein n=1 Tax=Hafnia paralvei TaxID=546367 RepID=UPI0010340DC6|nr:TraY domain-containing protein [Hafnia paralvei]TBL57057.1 TraY domain-containing protein [Hafnia paralvei]
MRDNGMNGKKRSIVSVYLDNETNSILTGAKNRSGRSKSIEVAMRLKDHLLRFPDFYNSTIKEELPTIK